MTRQLTFMLAAGLLTGALIISCQKEKTTTAPPQEEQIPSTVLEQISKKGFSTAGVKKVNGAYLVEGDILLDEKELAATSTSPTLRIGKDEQYRTNNLVTGLPRVIRVQVSSSLGANYVSATDNAIARYNALGLTITFVRVTSSPNITIVGATGCSYLASSGFPSGGNPYPTVTVCTTQMGTAPNVAWAATIIAHEIGHCIGFRHTDYYNRAISCGGSVVNEGSAGIGAILIPGTPSTATNAANSWMLACISLNQNRPFNSADIIALNYLY